ILLVNLAAKFDFALAGLVLDALALAGCFCKAVAELASGGVKVGFQLRSFLLHLGTERRHLLIESCCLLAFKLGEALLDYFLRNTLCAQSLPLLLKFVFEVGAALCFPLPASVV